MKLSELVCKIFGHKFSSIQLIIWEIKNNSNNVMKHGYTKLTCPRCGEVFDPTPAPPVTDGSPRQYTSHISPETLPDPPLPKWMPKSPPPPEPPIPPSPRRLDKMEQ